MQRTALATALLAATAAAPALADAHFHAEAAPYDTLTHTFTADRDGRMTVSIDGDDRTDLDLYLLNDRGEVIGSDINLTDRGEVSFRARAGQTVHIVIKNLDGRPNVFMLAYKTPDRASVPTQQVDSVEGDTTVSYDYRSTRSGWVRTDLIADENNDLDLYVYSDSHELLDYDIRVSSDGHIEFFAVAGRTYSIEVVNVSDEHTGYRMITEQR